MKRVAALLALGVVAPATAQIYGVVPNDRATQAGTASFLYMVTSGRTYQYIIHENQLTSFVGLELNGLTWRLLMSATTQWPPAVDAVFNNFDIYIGPGVEPANRSLTFANNYTGTPTQVRSGPLTIPAGSFQPTGTPRDWGFEIAFNGYSYTGGHLVIELRHSGMTGNTTTVSFDAIGTTTSPYLTEVAAVWQGTYTPTTGSQGNFFVTRLSAVPEPATLLGILAGLSVLARRRRRC